MEIVPGLHQLKLPMPVPALPYVFSYAFEGGDGVSLFDGGHGTPASVETLEAELKRLGYAPGDVRRIIVSHGHPDHLGSVGWLRERSPDCEVVMLAREHQWLAARRDPGNEGGGDGMASWMRNSNDWLVRHGTARNDVERAQSEGRDGPSWARAMHGRSDGGADGEQRRPPAGHSMMAVEADVKLDDGEVYEFDGWALRAVWTPGHTPGHLCMYDAERRLMFTGDHVLPHISPNVSMHAEDEDTSPLADFRASLEKVAKFDTAFALPAHEFTIADLPGRCERLLHHHDQRLDEVYEAVGERGATAYEVSAAVKWNTGPFEGFDLFMKRSALGETLSHLQLLLDEERLTRRDDGERVVWERA